MTVSLKHAFTSNVADSGDATLVQPSNWNAEHNLTANANSLLGTVTAGSVTEISCTSAGRDLIGGADAAAQRATLAAAGTGVTNTFTANQIVSVTDNTNAALRITQLGTGNALLVEDSTNPDATPTVVTADGTVVVGHTVALDTDNYAGTQITPKVQIQGVNNQNSTLSATTWVAGSGGPQIALGKSRSGTVGTNTVVQSGDVLGAVTFAGDDGTAIIIGASILGESDGTPGTNDMPGRLVFSTTADGAQTVTERLRIASTGAFGLSGANYGTSGQVLTSNGSNSAPSWGGPLIPSGSVMLFQQTAAPTGWTKLTTHDNKALRVVSGTASSGGTVAFTTAFASKAVSGTISNTTAGGTVGATTLTTAQMPSHKHTYTAGTGIVTATGTAVRLNNLTSTDLSNDTGLTGGGGSHDHSFTGISHTHTFTGTAIDLAVQYVDIILASKD